jgi:hypothetical protein
MDDLFKNACRIHLEQLVIRYLMANTEGRLDGVEKATRHMEMCQFYVCAYAGGINPESVSVNDGMYQSIHKSTQTMTDRMDESIGFPLSAIRPDYDRLSELFFNQFHDLARKGANMAEVSLPDILNVEK